MVKSKLSPISLLHYVKLVYRFALFAAALVMYIVSRMRNSGELFRGFERANWFLALIGVVYAVEMACRFFPSRLESMGCQKQFKRNYKPTGREKAELLPRRRTIAVIVSWVVLNGIIGALYFAELIDKGILILISLAYGVCDMICILFFCPFQMWMMKNRCCTDCRIYNWDFFMMFTPFLFIPHPFTWSLLGMSLILLVRWEIGLHRSPERFSETTNASLSCRYCEEKLCHHKKQLRQLVKKYKR